MSLRFKKAPTVIRSHAQCMREGRAVRAALATLDSTRAQAFLNTHHAGLSGRPLDLALASQAGLDAVEAVLRAEAGAEIQS